MDTSTSSRLPHHRGSQSAEYIWAADASRVHFENNKFVAADVRDINTCPYQTAGSSYYGSGVKVAFNKILQNRNSDIYNITSTSNIVDFFNDLITYYSEKNRSSNNITTNNIVKSYNNNNKRNNRNNIDNNSNNINNNNNEPQEERSVSEPNSPVSPQFKIKMATNINNMMKQISQFLKNKMDSLRIKCRSVTSLNLLQRWTAVRPSLAAPAAPRVTSLAEDALDASNNKSNLSVRPSLQHMTQAVRVQLVLSQRAAILRGVSLHLAWAIIQFVCLLVMFTLAASCRCVFEAVFPCTGGDNCPRR